MVGQYSIDILNLLKSDARCGYKNVAVFLCFCDHAAGAPPELFHRGGHMKGTKNTGVEHQNRTVQGHKYMYTIYTNIMLIQYFCISMAIPKELLDVLAYQDNHAVFD